MKNPRRIISILAVLGILVPAAVFAAGNILGGNSTSFLCSNTDCSEHTSVSWVTMNGSVTVTDTALTGQIWSSQFGWIHFNPSNGGVHNTPSGSVSGYAWGSTAGWVNFHPASGGVYINPANGKFSGWAWVQNGGWMRFDCGIVGACVETTWRGPVSSGGGGGGGGGDDGGGDDGTDTGGGDDGTTDGGGDDTGGGDTGGGDTGGGDTGGGDTGGGDTGGGGGNGGGDTGGGTVQDPPRSGWTNVCDPNQSTDTVDVIVGQVRSSYCQTVEKVRETRAAIKKVLESGPVGTVQKVVATTGVVAGATTAIVSGLFINPLSFSEIFLIPARLWSLLMAALGLKKRRRPWGTVYDSITKQPLDPAYVTLRTLEGKDVLSTLTDLDGRFGFVVPEPGTYSIFAQKTNYLFPSQKLVGRDHDELYRDLYFGEHFHVDNAGDVVIKNIPMDPEHFDWNEFAKKQQKLMRFYSKRDKILRRLSDIFFAAGFTVALIAAVAAPKPYNLAIIGMYVALFFIRRYTSHSRPYGDVTDAATGDPLSFALIRITSVSTGVEVMHRITDARGRYYALLPNASYKVRIDKKMPDESYQVAVEALEVTVKKGYLSEKFEV